MVIEWILAYAMLNMLHQSAPVPVAAMTSRSACMAEAERRNRTDENLRDPKVRQLGGEFVCLRIVRVTT